MQIGDKVRFLNEVGGGVVAGFQGKDIVLVEDEDGFNIPMLRSQVVAVETNVNNFERRPKKVQAEAPSASPAAAPSAAETPQVVHERKGGDLLNVCLAFVPVNSRELSNTQFETYLVNDSNYFVSVVFSNNEGAAWHLRWQGMLAPNTKQLLETFDRSILNDLERLSVQLIAWKQDKPYMMKPAVGVELRLDTVKFYKLHVFRSSPFFHEPALLYDIVRDDRPVRQVFVEATEVMERISEEAEEQDYPADSDIPDNPEIPETVPVIPQRTREEEREALKAAKRALKAEQQAKLAKKKAAEAERDPHFSKPNILPEKEDIIEVDLHINALLENTNGLSPSVLLNTQLTEFRIMMDRNIKKKGQRIVFIHGKGEGVLREALIKELSRRYHGCTYEDASFQKYGYGATMVTIR